MKKIAILVIAAFDQEVYKHYINTYWTDLIKYTNQYKENIDIYLLFDRDMSLIGYEDIIDNIIVDGNRGYNGFVDKDKGTNTIPGILSKTIYAFEKLKDEVDVVFRTNLSSMLDLEAFENHVETNNIIYSGGYGWPNALRSHLMYLKSVGAYNHLKYLDELDIYEGNTFFSGCGYFLNKDEINQIIDNKERIRYDIIDDISLGLMCNNSKVLDGFLMKITKTDDYESIIKKLNENYIHIRLEHLSLEKAKVIYTLIKEKYPNYLPYYKDYIQNKVHIRVVF